MAIPRGSLNADDVVNRYTAGESVERIAASLGASNPSVYRLLKLRGVAVRGRALKLDESAIVASYRGGASEKHVADKLGISRGTVRRVLVARGVKIRGRSDAERLKWSKLKKDPAAVRRQCGAAWAATEGRPKSAATKAAFALTSFLRFNKRMGRGEPEITAILAGAGFKPVRQFPVGPYNIDVALEAERIAVEVVGNPPTNAAAARLFERTKYLLDGGWCVVFVYCGRLWANGRSSGKLVTLDRSFVAEDLIALANRARRNESVHGRYRVIRGDGKPTTMLRHYLDDLPVV